MIYSFSPDERLSQGDILRGVKIVVNVCDPETNAPKYNDSHIIVLSRNCEIDKPIKVSTGTNSALVARVIRLASIHSSLQGDIRKNRIVNAFFLPRSEYIEECYVDWRTTQPVDKSNLMVLRSQNESYKCTVGKELLEDLFESYFVFLTKPE